MKTHIIRQEIKKTFDNSRRTILRSWNSALQSYETFQDPDRFMIIKKEQENEQDLFSVLHQLGAVSEEKLLNAATPIVNRIHTPLYSVSDFAIETYCLEGAIFQLMIEKGMPAEQWIKTASLLRKDIFDIRRIILRRSVGVYEYVIENGKWAFSYFKTNGEILYANKTMISLMQLSPSYSGKRITDFFAPQDSALIKKMLKDQSGCFTIFAPLTFKNCQGAILPVGAEICPVILDGNPVGGYASLVNLEIVMKSQKQVYEKSPIGIIKVNKQNAFTYANPAARDMIGAKKLTGRPIRELFKQKKAWHTVKKQLATRFKKGMASEYETEIVTLGDRPRNIPVRISGIPETDLKGEIIGSMALIHSLEMEKACDAIHEKIETFETIESLHKDIAEIVNGLVPFREMIISDFSSDRKHIRTITWRPDLGFCDQEWGGVWWAVPGYLKSWLFDPKNTYISDIESFFKHPRRADLLTDPAVQLFIKKKLQSMVRCLIFREKKLIATISFFREKKNAFSQNEIEMIKKLPLRKAVLTARYEAEKARMRFRLNLMNEIYSVCDDLEKVGQTIVENLAEHYQWHNASFFSVDRANKVFRLKGQYAPKAMANNGYLLAPGYTQGLKEGVLGYVCKHKRTVNISNIKTDERFKKLFVSAYEKTMSELCFPILINRQVCWILNVEDARENAFSKDQVDSLKLILSEVREILKRAHAYHIHQLTLDSTSDAVITTDAQGKVSTINPAGEALLQLTTEDQIGKSLRKFFQDKALFDRLMSNKNIVISGKETYIRGVRSKSNYVLLSSSPLPEELGGRVFIAKDISLLERVRELEYLGQMTYEVALQTKTPLALMFSWLGRLDQADESDQPDLIEKLTKQLKKIELTTDRMAMLETGKGLVPYNAVMMDFSEIFRSLKKDFPKSEINRIEFKDEHTPPFMGDLFQIKFCIETILSHLLRYLPREKRIEVQVKNTTNWIKCRIKGFLPPPNANTPCPEDGDLRQTLKDIALGEPVIKQFIQKVHEGKYRRLKRDPGQFQIDLPIRGSAHE